MQQPTTITACAVFDGAYEEAIKAFEKCRSSRQYSGLVPYYITQIYFAQNKFDKLIDYAEPKLNNGILSAKYKGNGSAD